MIKIKKTLPTYHSFDIEFSEKELIDVLKERWEKTLGIRCFDEMLYLNKNNEWESWTSWPHGSGTTTVYRKATDKELIILESFKIIHDIFN